MTPAVLHLHTYFLFPFSINREAASLGHGEDWKGERYWINGLDRCIAAYGAPERCGTIGRLGYWQRAPYARSDMESPGYQDMVFFHPFVRRIFFDTEDQSGSAGSREALIRCYRIPLDGRRVFYKAEDTRERRGCVQVTDLRLYLFANGMGILSLGVEASNLSAKDALWINEAMRKIYPSSGRQLREGRVPHRFWLTIEQDGREETIVEEGFDKCRMIGFQPPLSAIIRSLIYFLNYDKYEYEQLLDERMIVYSYLAIDPSTVPADFIGSERCQVLLSRFLYVDNLSDNYRYEPDFTREQMNAHVYRRWAHEGTYYGFTSYSNVTLALGVYDRGEHVSQEGFLIHRMFDTRYYLMAIVALFYRASLLDFAQKTALVSRRLYRDQESGAISRDNIEIANALRAEFLHFSNYWYFEELANKDEEIEHFDLQCRAYRIGAMRAEVEQEIEKLNASLFEYHQRRSTEAVNRLALVSIVFGFGAVVTGFFGMNFAGHFEQLFFNPEAGSATTHYLALIAVSLLALGALAFGAYLIVSHPADYRDILLRLRKKTRQAFPLVPLEKIPLATASRLAAYGAVRASVPTTHLPRDHGWWRAGQLELGAGSRPF